MPLSRLAGMVIVVAFVVLGLLAAGSMLLIVELLRRLFWLALRLAASGVVALVGAVTVAGAVAPDQQWIGAPVALALAAMMLGMTRRWGAVSIALPPRKPDAAGSVAAPRLRMPTERHDELSPIVPPALRHRLADTQAALVRAARDDLGVPAAEWLAFWQRRVPDLIAAAQGAHDDAEPLDKPAVAARLAEHLVGIIAQADQRIAQVRAARRDRFATLGRHADVRVRDG